MQHSLVQIAKQYFFKQLFHQYSIPWYRLQNVFFSKSYFTNTAFLVQIVKQLFSNIYFTKTAFLGTDSKNVEFFQTVISPIQHSLVQIANFFFPYSYFTNTAFLGTNCKMLFFKQLLHQYSIPWYRL